MSLTFTLPEIATLPQTGIVFISSDMRCSFHQRQLKIKWATLPSYQAPNDHRPI